jgi:hypothetical protein
MNSPASFFQDSSKNRFVEWFRIHGYMVILPGHPTRWAGVGPGTWTHDRTVVLHPEAAPVPR